ncbi:hypothetical protein N7456_006928 [Penicillium angulare]|uniref:Uncharacterized protein n=1 Tax=Penicillium angulare TaxID=116970 RepID=A0A9W9KCN6_9EURO|nr:hypothetical protein N7456_006928 [Penicillium angulare]
MVHPTGRQCPRKSLTSAEAWEKVESTAYRLGIAWHLGPKQSKQVSEAFSSLSHPSASTSHRKYRLFLHEVRRTCGLQGVRLCAAALGQNNVRDMNVSQRDALVRKLGEEKYRLLINNPSFPSIVGDTQVFGLLEAHLGSLEVEEYSEPILDFHESSPLTAHARFLQDDWQVSTDLANTQEVFEHASLEGIAAVFNGAISGAIRIRTNSSSTSVKTCSKASVTTVFPPWGGPVDCLLSLDICESMVQALAMALFNARVKWAENSLHVSFERGANLTIPNSEVTLKGVGDEAIAAVFGSEIQHATRESPIRLRELEEGRLMTECVSMIITEKSAIVNLSLGLIRGLEIQKKLYT